LLTKGNAVRIQEILHHEGLEIRYSTLTRLIQQQDLRMPVTRSGRYDFPAADEMQHDTSPHTLEIAGKKVNAQCAGMILPFSRYCYVQYYSNFTRFEAKVFITDALTFYDGACPRCTIDNTSVLVASGSGPEAIINAEMRYLGDYYQMKFIPHAIGHADRKAHVERLFYYIERNFLAGRTFSSWQDVNEQVILWCQQVANVKKKRALDDTPENVFNDTERHALIPLPSIPLPVYQAATRIVDSQGYIHLDANRYSMPERLIDKKVEVLKYLNKVVIYFNREKMAEHDRFIGVRLQRSTIKGHHKTLGKKWHKEPSHYETKLRNIAPVLDEYLNQLIKSSPGRGVTKLKQLIALYRDYPQNAFLSAITEALKYGLYDMIRLENMILKQIEGDFFNLGGDDV